MRKRLSIGEFSAATHLSVRTLRRYHDNGLLTPAQVDEWGGYRFYDPQQIGVAQTIRRLRELDMPVREIAELLSDSGDRQRQALLTDHLSRLEDRLSRTAEAVSALRRLLEPRTEPMVVERRNVDTLTVASISATVEHDAVLEWYAAAMTELDDVLIEAGRRADGPPGALIDDAIFAHGRGQVTVFLPVDEPLTHRRVAPLTLPAAEFAVTTHIGNHSDIDVTYGELARWIVEHGFDFGGPVRERYVIGPRDSPLDAEWRTEISWAIT